MHACDLPESDWENNRAVNLPGLVTTPAELIHAMGRAGGDMSLVNYEVDNNVASIVATWPGYMVTERALAMGFVQDKDVDSLVKQYVDSSETS